MKPVKNLVVIGGDSRQKYMAQQLEKSGFAVSVYAVARSNGEKELNGLPQAIERCDAVILPLPVTKDGRTIESTVPVKATLDNVADMMKSGQLLFAGMVDRSLRSKFAGRGIKVYDYFEREEVKVMNCLPTAQGILKTALENIDYTICGSRCLVTGYGRVGQAAAQMLHALGAQVTVCARKFSDLAWAQTRGMRGITFEALHEHAGEFDIAVNTVPVCVIDREILTHMRKDILIIDVASAPFGTDFAAACELDIKALQCSSLPGKVAPMSAGRIIADGIINIIGEGEYE